MATRFAILASDPAQPWQETIEVVRRAEELGFDAVCMWDHPNFPGMDPHTGLTALAMATSRIRLWASVMSVAYHPPSMLARTMASLDVISRGRLILGLGTGWDEREFAAYGFRFEAKAARDIALAEAIQIIRAMWTAERATFRGTSWSVVDAVCEPKPIQTPHPPIWVGSHGGPRMLRDVVVPLADGCNIGIPSAEARRSVDEVLVALRRLCESAGRDPDSLIVSTNLLVHGATTGSDLNAMYSGHVDTKKVLSLEDPQRIVERVETLAHLGVHQIAFGLRSSSPLDDLAGLAEVIRDRLRTASITHSSDG